MQRFMSGFQIKYKVQYVNKSRTYTYSTIASTPAMTGSAFMRKYILVLVQCVQCVYSMLGHSQFSSWTLQFSSWPLSILQLDTSILKLATAIPKLATLNSQVGHFNSQVGHYNSQVGHSQFLIWPLQFLSWPLQFPIGHFNSQVCHFNSQLATSIIKLDTSILMLATSILKLTIYTSLLKLAITRLAYKLSLPTVLVSWLAHCAGQPLFTSLQKPDTWSDFSIFSDCLFTFNPCHRKCGEKRGEGWGVRGGGTVKFFSMPPISELSIICFTSK